MATVLTNYLQDLANGYAEYRQKLKTGLLPLNVLLNLHPDLTKAYRDRPVVNPSGESAGVPMDTQYGYMYVEVLDSIVVDQQSTWHRYVVVYDLSQPEGLPTKIIDTHDEAELTSLGLTLTSPIGMHNDYINFYSSVLLDSVVFPYLRPSRVSSYDFVRYWREDWDILDGMKELAYNYWENAIRSSHFVKRMRSVLDADTSLSFIDKHRAIFGLLVFHTEQVYSTAVGTPAGIAFGTKYNIDMNALRNEANALYASVDWWHDFKPMAAKTLAINSYIQEDFFLEGGMLGVNVYPGDLLDSSPKTGGYEVIKSTGVLDVLRMQTDTTYIGAFINIGSGASGEVTYAAARAVKRQIYVVSAKNVYRYGSDPLSVGTIVTLNLDDLLGGGLYMQLESKVALISYRKTSSSTVVSRKYSGSLHTEQYFSYAAKVEYRTDRPSTILDYLYNLYAATDNAVYVYTTLLDYGSAFGALYLKTNPDNPNPITLSDRSPFLLVMAERTETASSADPKLLFPSDIPKEYASTVHGPALFKSIQRYNNAFYYTYSILDDFYVIGDGDGADILTVDLNYAPVVRTDYDIARENDKQIYEEVDGVSRIRYVEFDLVERHTFSRTIPNDQWNYSTDIFNKQQMYGPIPAHASVEVFYGVTCARRYKVDVVNEVLVDAKSVTHEYTGSNRFGVVSGIARSIAGLLGSGLTFYPARTVVKLLHPDMVLNPEMHPEYGFNVYSDRPIESYGWFGSVNVMDKLKDPSWVAVYGIPDNYLDLDNPLRWGL